MEVSNAAYAVCLLRIRGIGPLTLGPLLLQTGSWRALFEAPIKQLVASGINTTKLDTLEKGRLFASPVKEQELINKHGILSVSLTDSNYPTLLKQISDPPPILFYQGTLPNTQPLLTVVGTRNPSTYGREVVKNIIPPIARQGIGIVSGLAYGIDTLAHVATLDAGGYTIGVLAGGHDSIYSTQKDLVERILKNGGAIMTEMPIGTKLDKGLFPRRNRLVAGVSQGTLVIEAALKSGSLITARHALEANRCVMSVPGPIFQESCEGTNALIENGATLIKNAADILEAYSFYAHKIDSAPTPKLTLTATEEQLWAIINHDPKHIETIVEESGLKSLDTITLLSLMELKGLIKDVGGKWYIRS